MHNEREDMSREAFETWWESEGQFLRAGGGDYEKTFAFHAWQAAQADAFERAAKVCLDQKRNLKDTKYVRRNAKRNLYLWRCADSIRVLAKENKR